MKLALLQSKQNELYDFVNPQRRYTMPECTRLQNSFYCNMYDTANYLITAEDIHGPWSEPTALNNFGFDPSLFHDDDGRKYMVSMMTDHRIPKKYKGRIILQEYDPIKKR